MQQHTARGAAQALYRVLVVPALSSRGPSRPVVPRTCTHKSHQCSPSTSRRAFTTTLSRPTKTRAPEKRTQKWNDEIRALQIQLVDPETNALLDDGEPRTRFDVLGSMDKNTHRLVQLTPDEEGVHPRDAIPVCKIISKKEMYEQDRKRKTQGKEKAKESAKVNTVKTLELNWAIDGNDLEHRLEKVAEFLGEGRRVELVLAAKKRGRKATTTECEGVLKKIEGTTNGVSGASVMKPLEGKLGGFGTMVLQGKPPSAVKNVDP